MSLFRQKSREKMKKGSAEIRLLSQRGRREENQQRKSPIRENQFGNEFWSLFLNHRPTVNIWPTQPSPNQNNFIYLKKETYFFVRNWNGKIMQAEKTRKSENCRTSYDKHAAARPPKTSHRKEQNYSTYFILSSGTSYCGGERSSFHFSDYLEKPRWTAAEWGNEL